MNERLTVGAEQPAVATIQAGANGIALVIPVRNEEASIEALLDTIREQTVQPDEVILVDGGSTDQTKELIRKRMGSNNRIKLIETENSMPGRGRNIGAEQSSVEWLAFTDAGIRLDPAWLENLVRQSALHPESDIVYGNFSPVTDHLFEKAAAIAYVPALETGKIRSKSIASCLVRKSTWKKAGGFPDWRAAEDLIFMEKAEQLNPAVATAPASMAYWELRPNLSGTFRRFDLYSKFNVWAGRQAYWHYGILRQYLVIPVAILLSIFISPYFLLLIPVWVAARVMKRLWMHRQEYGNGIFFNPALFFTIMAILLTIDAATFSGWIKARNTPNGH